MRTPSERDRFIACTRATRPGEVWFALALLHRRHQLTDDVVTLIFERVMEQPFEREGRMACVDKCDRMRAARRDAGAEDVVPLWKLLHFSSLLHYLQHVRDEREWSERRSQLAATPEWVLGIESRRMSSRRRWR